MTGRKYHIFGLITDEQAVVGSASSEMRTLPNTPRSFRTYAIYIKKTMINEVVLGLVCCDFKALYSFVLVFI